MENDQYLNSIVNNSTVSLTIKFKSLGLSRDRGISLRLLSKVV